PDGCGSSALPQAHHGSGNSVSAELAVASPGDAESSCSNTSAKTRHSFRSSAAPRSQGPFISAAGRPTAKPDSGLGVGPLCDNSLAESIAPKAVTSHRTPNSPANLHAAADAATVTLSTTGAGRIADLRKAHALCRMRQVVLEWKIACGLLT